MWTNLFYKIACKALKKSTVALETKQYISECNSVLFVFNRFFSSMHAYMPALQYDAHTLALVYVSPTCRNTHKHASIALQLIRRGSRKFQTCIPFSSSRVINSIAQPREILFFYLFLFCEISCFWKFYFEIFFRLSLYVFKRRKMIFI